MVVKTNLNAIDAYIKRQKKLNNRHISSSDQSSVATESERWRPKNKEYVTKCVLRTLAAAFFREKEEV